ncbi:hypothetical protein B0H13DRAFT_2309313 [Mycena leptocephala]|nr:hypothetical protein B0H13DRAFT_2309313 [Mycena leptocephala]
MDGDASHRTWLLVKALLDCGMGPTLLGCGRCARGGRGAGSVSPGVIAQVALTSAIPILEAKNAYTHSSSIACRPFQLYIVNIMRGCGETDERLDGSLSVRSLSTPSSFFSFISIAGLVFLASGIRGTRRAGHGRAGIHALVRGGWRARAALGLAPAMYVRIPPHAALHFCAVSYEYSCWVYAWCIALFPIPLRTVYAGSSMVGTGLMLLSCSSSGAGVGTVRQGVRGVCGQNVLWEGYCARRGIRVRVLEEECLSRAAALENCRDFTIQGGTFNVSSTTMEESPGNFRIVKLGDLNLLDEIDKDNVVEWHPIHRKKTGVVVRYLKVVVGTRRTYRARIFGSQDPMTAIVYNDAQFEQVRHHLHV